VSIDSMASPAPGRPAWLRRADIEPGQDRRRTSSASAVLLAALDHGPVARSTIARLAGLSPAAVSRKCAELSRAGLLRDVVNEAEAKRVGRPHIPVDIDVDRPVVCGLHIAVRNATLGVLDLRGRVMARERIAHDGAAPEPVLSRVARRIPQFLAEHAAGRRVLGLGVATGGWVDPAAGVMVDHPILRWRDVRVRELLTTPTGLPVLVDSHARALVRAEQLFGDRRTRSSAVHLFVGNVVDVGFATGGTVHHGPRSAAGAVAHLALDGRTDPCACGRAGCLQAAVSEHTLALRAAGERIIGEPRFAALLAAAQAGDLRAISLFHERARLVATAAATLLDVLNPEVLVVAEAGVQHLPGCLEILRAEVRARSHTCADPAATVVVTSFGGDVLPVAAGAVLLDAVYADPRAFSMSGVAQKRQRVLLAPSASSLTKAKTVTGRTS
jgi:predicted NBD/HSP70 family sugar kinase